MCTLKKNPPREQHCACLGKWDTSAVFPPDPSPNICQTFGAEIVCRTKIFALKLCFNLEERQHVLSCHSARVYEAELIYNYLSGLLCHLRLTSATRRTERSRAEPRWASCIRGSTESIRFFPFQSFFLFVYFFFLRLTELKNSCWLEVNSFCRDEKVWLCTSPPWLMRIHRQKISEFFN